MEELTKERLQVLSKAWRKNQQPKYPCEFDALLPLLDPNGKPMATVAKISWNTLRDRYEMEPVIETGSGSYSLVELQISAANYEKLKQMLADLGVHKDHRVKIIGKNEVEAVPNIPRSFFPTIVGR